MHNQKLITTYLKDYLILKGTQPGKAQDNPNTYKKNHPFRTIINGSNHATEKMAKVVEQELSENVRNLNTYIKDTTDFLQKLNNISQSGREDIKDQLIQRGYSKGSIENQLKKCTC
jgi:hypothetical protein